MTEMSRNVLSRKQEAGLLALVVSNSVSEAAAQAGVSQRTVTRWLGTDAFRDAYRAQARETSAQAVTALMGGQLRAVEVLLKGLDSDTDAVRTRTATKLLELGIRVREDDIAERLEALERAVELERAARARLERGES